MRRADRLWVVEWKMRDTAWQIRNASIPSLNRADGREEVWALRRDQLYFGVDVRFRLRAYVPERKGK